jgi:hypothetical protein
MNKGMLGTMIDNVLQRQNIPNLSSISRFTSFQSKYEPLKPSSPSNIRVSVQYLFFIIVLVLKKVKYNSHLILNNHAYFRSNPAELCSF